MNVADWIIKNISKSRPEEVRKATMTMLASIFNNKALKGSYEYPLEDHQKLLGFKAPELAILITENLQQPNIK